MKATIKRDSDDLRLADATGVFVRVPKETADTWRDRYIRVEG